MVCENDDDVLHRYASPPCLAHEIDPAYGSQVLVDPQQALEVTRWRKAERVRLLAERLSLPVAARRTATETIEAHLDRFIADHVDEVAGLTISAWWPINAELDLRPWLGRVVASGARAALPVVVKRAEPLVFRFWSRDARMEPGVWDIPVPVNTSDCVPDVCLIPLVGWDVVGYRLGYGGGYFDRTLAALSPRPLTIGIGLQGAQLATIFPQPHDISMVAIITEAGLVVDSR